MTNTVPASVWLPTYMYDVLALRSRLHGGSISDVGREGNELIYLYPETNTFAHGVVAGGSGR